jgi:hypothetical protein
MVRPDLVSTDMKGIDGDAVFLCVVILESQCDGLSCFDCNRTYIELHIFGFDRYDKRRLSRAGITPKQ